MARAIGLGGLVMLAIGCESAYYGAMERFGVEKRDILADRVEDARDAQQTAKKQFSSALEAFRATTDYEGGDLEALYDELSSELERSRSRAEVVRERIDSIEDVATDLFGEWESELDEYSSERLRQASADRLRRTRRRYEDLMDAMLRAQDRMEPVLAAFQDQVLSLKHNLNARTVAALRGELTSIETNVAELIRRMEAAIDKSERFLSNLRDEG